MERKITSVGALMGVTAIIFGAFGAHALKKRMSDDLLKSFETGVKYQMYHALALLLLPQLIPFQTGLEQSIGWCFIVGTLLFSFSIYGLCITSMSGNKWRFLGPITPLGGLLLVTGWITLLFSVYKI